MAFANRLPQPRINFVKGDEDSCSVIWNPFIKVLNQSYEVQGRRIRAAKPVNARLCIAGLSDLPIALTSKIRKSTAMIGFD